jgi:hypothetical protein
LHHTKRGAWNAPQEIFVVSGKIVAHHKAKRPAFRTDEIVCQSGIYAVRHLKHRFPHEVSLIRDQRFPRCAKCGAAVIFELVRVVTDEAANFATRIFLYELPVLEDDQAAAG